MMKGLTKLTTLVFVLALLASCAGKKEKTAEAGQSPAFWKVAQTPPMGWNSWDCYGPNVTEEEVKANADYMAEKLKAHGWEYIIVDIRWYVENDKAGATIKPTRFTRWTNMAD
jgi:hypothetical protein